MLSLGGQKRDLKNGYKEKSPEEGWILYERGASRKRQGTYP